MQANLKQRRFANSRLLHTMLRVSDLERSLAFYTGILGMRLLRRQDFPLGSYTLAFVGYDDMSRSATLELCYNWDSRPYSQGDGYGHLAISVEDVVDVTASLAAVGVPVIRAAGPLAGFEEEWIAFVEDPDGYRIELIQGI